MQTLERLLSEQTRQASATPLQANLEDRELAQHLQVTVRKNRELRGELEVMKNKVQVLMEEREEFSIKLNRDHQSLRGLFEETQRAKEALAGCIKTLSAEKNELAERLQNAEEEIVRLRASGATAVEAFQFEDINGNVDDTAVINEALKESLRQMKLRKSGGANGASPQPQVGFSNRSFQ